jgi:hypothetical protein
VYKCWPSSHLEPLAAGSCARPRFAVTTLTGGDAGRSKLRRELRRIETIKHGLYVSYTEDLSTGFLDIDIIAQKERCEDLAGVKIEIMNSIIVLGNVRYRL